MQAHPREPFLRRRRQLARRLAPAGLDAILVSHPVNVTYLTGFSGEASYLIVGRKRTLMVSDGRFTTQLAEECPGLDMHIRPPSQTTVPEVAKVLTGLGFRKVGFESSHLTVADFEWFKSLAPAIDWAPAKGWVEAQRAVKDAGEIGQIKAAIVVAERAFTAFRAGFLGKCSPVHFFWGAFDLAVTRFSGRPAPRHPGGVPHLPDWVVREAYSHEVCSAGFWPGDRRFPSPAFYSYAYPEPGGFREAAVRPSGASYSTELREFLLPYDEVRTAASPDGVLLEFLESTYQAAADLGRWDRSALERTGDPRGA